MIFSVIETLCWYNGTDWWICVLRLKMTTISIIDDDRIVREAVADLVKSLGYEVATYESAEDFLDGQRLAQTSCLITDLQMPGLNGLELQSQLRAQGHSIPVIFVTAFPEEKFRQRAMSAGAIGFLSKPFDEAGLIDCLEAARGFALA
jgi:FixJ family two-component response regulator